MRFERRFTTAGQDPYETIDFRLVQTKINGFVGILSGCCEPSFKTHGLVL